MKKLRMTEEPVKTAAERIGLQTKARSFVPTH